MLVILAWAGVRAYGAWHFLAARSITTSMIETTGVSQSGINEATARIKLALKRFPANPEYLDLAGKLQSLQALQYGVPGKAQREALESSAEYYRKALKARPLWPYSWTGLLNAKEALGQIDPEFHLALAQSIKTGPREPYVQLQVIKSGLRHWGRLEKTEREMIRETIKDALASQPREVFEVVSSYQRPDLICDEDVDYRQIRNWCEIEYASG